MSEITRMLDRLSELRSAADMLRMEKRELIDRAVPPEVKQALADIEAECQPEIEAVETMAVELEGQIRDAVLKEGETVKGAHLSAVYQRPRVTWDGKLLEGMKALVPQLEAARKIGEPTVQIRNNRS